MNPALIASCLVPIPLAVAIWRLAAGPGPRLWAGLAIAAAAIAVLVVSSPLPAGHFRTLVDLDVGSLAATRLVVGVVLGGLAAHLVETVVGRPSGSGLAATTVLLAAPALLVVTSTGLVTIAIGCGLLLGIVWARWTRVAGPQLPVRSLARETVLAVGAVLAAAALTPSVESGSAPGVMVAILLAAAVASLMGVVPFSILPEAARRVGPAEAALWRVWVLPVGALLGLRLVAATPRPVGVPLQELLIALGVASAIIWGAHSIIADPEARYWSSLAADCGLMAVAVGLGSPTAVAALLLLLITHWLAGSVLGENTGRRSQLLAWVGVSGTPPFGGFTGRLLLVLAAAPISGVLVGLLLLASGLQLAGAAVGMRAAAGTAAPGALRRELPALAVAIAALALGVLPQQALSWVFGVHL